MIKINLRSFILFCFMFLLCRCTSTATLHTENKFITGTLTQEGLQTVRSILSIYAKQPLHDTILIKYDYTNETCWDRLDKESDEYNMRVVKGNQMKIRLNKEIRPDISIFEFRQGNVGINKLKSWNDSILIDSDEKLYKMLFKPPVKCGTSIIIMPDKKYVMIRSDSHFSALDLSGKNINSLLAPEPAIKK